MEGVTDLPIPYERFDIEPQSRADAGDVLTIDLLQDGRLSSVI
jgi:hypothetical protein